MLVDVVKPYCLQWQDIYFALPISAQRQLNTCTFPCLERLIISSTHAEPSDRTADPVIIRDAPLLHKAQIFYIPSLQVNLLMQKLAILHVRCMCIPQIIAVLRCCPNLVDLICGRTETGGGPVAPTPVQLRALRRLYIPDKNFLRVVCLTAPRLERLQIGCPTNVQATTDALHALVSRSSCTLKFLSVHFGGVSGTTAEIQRLFHAANTIEHLKLGVASSKAPLLQALRIADVLPRLRHLEVHDWITVAGHRARLLLDMLAWRRKHGALETFELFVILTPSGRCDLPSAAIIAEFRALGEAGLEVRIATRRRSDSMSPDVVLLDTLQPVSS
jgi:hypothetical protein